MPAEAWREIPPTSRKHGFGVGDRVIYGAERVGIIHPPGTVTLMVYNPGGYAPRAMVVVYDDGHEVTYENPGLFLLLWDDTTGKASFVEERKLSDDHPGS